MLIYIVEYFKLQVRLIDVVSVFVNGSVCISQKICVKIVPYGLLDVIKISFCRVLNWSDWGHNQTDNQKELISLYNTVGVNELNLIVFNIWMIIEMFGVGLLLNEPILKKNGTKLLLWTSELAFREMKLQLRVLRLRSESLIYLAWWRILHLIDVCNPVI